MKTLSTLPDWKKPQAEPKPAKIKKYRATDTFTAYRFNSNAPSSGGEPAPTYLGPVIISVPDELTKHGTDGNFVEAWTNGRLVRINKTDWETKVENVHW